MKNVLLINTTQEVPARMLQDRDDIRLSVITTPAYRGLYDEDTDVELVDSIADLTQVRLTALRIRERNPFDHVVSPQEWSVLAGGYIRSYFGLPGIDFAVANAFSNKFVMKQQLAAAGLPVPRFRRLNTFTDALAAGDELGWPLIVKRACGGGSGYVLALDGPDHLRSLAADRHTNRMRSAPYPLMAEELIDMEAEFHVDAVVCDGKTRFAAVSRYLTPVLNSVGGGIGSYTLPDHHPDTRTTTELHDQVITALGLTDGITHLETFKTPTGHLIGEIACRPGGGGIAPQLHHQYNLDLWKTFLHLSLNEPVNPDTTPRTDHMAQYMLPRPTGTITTLTTTQELTTAPGVVHADIKATPGDTLEGPLDSSIYAGIVLIRADTEEQIHQRIAHIDNLFHIEVAG
jgi:biotin carboxylase